MSQYSWMHLLMDAFAEQMPVYDENFTGPAGIASLFNEEYEEDDEEYYDEDGSYQQEPLETSASQRVDPDETTQAETVSGHTQCLAGVVCLFTCWAGC